MLGNKKTAVGLDIGTHSIKLVQLERKHDQVKLVNYAIQEIFPEGKEYDAEKDNTVEYVSALSDVFKRLKIDPKRLKQIYTSIGGEAVSVKQIKTVSLTEDELESSLRFEARKHLPVGSSEIILDYQILGEDKDQGKIDVLLVVTTRKAYTKHAALLQQIGIKETAPVIDVDSLALVNSYVLLNAVNDDEIVVILNIGATRSVLAIYHRKGLFFTRDIPYGGNHFTHDLMREYDVDFGVGEQIKYDKGIFPQADIDDNDPVTSVKMSRPSISLAEKQTQEMLVDEVRRSLRYYFKESGRNDFSRVLLTGGSAKIHSMDAFLSGQLHLPVSVYNPLEYMNLPGNMGVSEEPQIAQAVGLALRFGE
ncbi:MAG: type IV pilus assembly protein PilM [Gemmatimonadetes bacterium]|nr:MAG: type IV pilus assembly protein PilM [Gemmatimonadota bacterium]